MRRCDKKNGSCEIGEAAKDGEEVKNEWVPTWAAEKNYNTRRCGKTSENYLKRTGAAKLCDARRIKSVSEQAGNDMTACEIKRNARKVTSKQRARAVTKEETMEALQGA